MAAQETYQYLWIQANKIKHIFIYLKQMKNITADDMINDNLKFIAENAGIKSVLILILLLAGLTINIPKYNLRKLKEKYIMKEYDGSKFTINRLAVECDLS